MSDAQPTTAPSDDRRLLELGRRWREVYRDDVGDIEELLRLEDEIAEAPAATLEGVAVKARAIDPDVCQDKLLRSVRADVLRIAGEQR